MGSADKLSDAQWRSRLTPSQYQVLRQSGTEPAFTGDYYQHDLAGEYRCAGCGEPLFSSAAKFESGSGWPSFYEPLSDSAGERREDSSHGMSRTEFRCGVCDGHLGHVFPDGPAPTGQRYCINSAALVFEAAKQPRATGEN
ncbi:MAG: peptide-methionine (R)-S-oxide reductase MsrB [Candidatus Marinimicrobia bacterium]|nr:peptide-methionine (R)-S-oxide reductase MsrB [Candidatus Neomarinimicrobiota bacterium]